MTRRLEPPTFGEYPMICPFCEGQYVGKLTQVVHEVTCSCGKKFNVLLATVRGKHSRKSGCTRKYHIRTVTHIGERELAFEDYNDDYDIPMRSNDVTIVYWSEEPKITIAVYNLTIKQYSSIYWLVPRFSKLGKKHPDIAGLNKTALVVSKYLEDPEFKKDFDSLTVKPLTQIP